MKKFMKGIQELLVRHGVLELVFDTDYPKLIRVYINAVTEPATKKVNRRSFMDARTGAFFWQYKFHFRWISLSPTRNI